MGTSLNPLRLPFLQVSLSHHHQQADSSAGVSVMRGLLAKLSKRIRNMNDKLATSKKSTLHDFWSTSQG